MINCKICGSESLQKITRLPLETAGGTINSEVTRCLSCKTFSRSVDYSDSEVQSHFELTSYTDPKFEKQFLESKRIYFEYILQLIRPLIDISSGKTSCLDIGSSYGHMLEIFKRNGIAVQGVEIVDRLRKELEKRDYQVYKAISEVPPENIYDIITFIDSLYYFEDPVEILAKIRCHLNDDGILVIRIPNRTPFLSLAILLKVPIKTSLFLDAKHNFSFQGLKIMFEKTGFKLLKVVVKEKGKKPIVDVRGRKMPLFKRIYGLLSGIICFVPITRIRIIFSPGLLLFCVRDKTVEQMKS